MNCQYKKKIVPLNNSVTTLEQLNKKSLSVKFLLIWS